MVKACNPKGKFQKNPRHQNSMAFIFENQADVQKILNQSWSFHDSQIIIQHWPPDKALTEVDMTKIHLWIQAHNLPVNLMNIQTATSIGNHLGKFLKADLKSNWMLLSH